MSYWTIRLIGSLFPWEDRAIRKSSHIMPLLGSEMI